MAETELKRTKRLLSGHSLCKCHAPLAFGASTCGPDHCKRFRARHSFSPGQQFLSAACLVEMRAVKVRQRATIHDAGGMHNT